MTTGLESGLIIPLAEAERVVGMWRERLDGAATLGVPAHVTVLYPFLPPDTIDDGVLQALREMYAGVDPFDVELAGVAWFGQDVVYAVPRPDDVFRRLTADALLDGRSVLRTVEPTANRPLT